MLKDMYLMLEEEKVIMRGNAAKKFVKKLSKSTRSIQECKWKTKEEEAKVLMHSRDLK